MANEERIELYLLAGVGTAPYFMREFGQTLAALLMQESGCQTEAELLFPYGDWSCLLRKQLLEVWHDIRLPFAQLDRSIGGLSALQRIEEGLRAGSVEEIRVGSETEILAGNEAELRARNGVGMPAGSKAGRTEKRIVLLGHSGGGTAALHAAALLKERNPGLQALVIQIGSPRSPVPPALSGSVAYCFACRPGGTGKDPVCRLGSWRQQRWRSGNAGAGAGGTGMTGGEVDRTGSGTGVTGGEEGRAGSSTGTSEGEEGRAGSSTGTSEGSSVHSGAGEGMEELVNIPAGPSARGYDSETGTGFGSPVYGKPGIMIPLPIVGGHRDYFRTRLVDAAGRTNLEHTTAAVWSYIRESWF
ncbi:MAG: hypothetical protein K0R57_1034 [Paenibacillaceae bacterium]|nr:hypothetical protein [Paenibacillaceae bacterium]